MDPLPDVRYGEKEFRSYMDAVEHFYEMRIFAGIPELFTPRGNVRRTDLKICFPLNVGTLSDFTIVDEKVWGSMKK